MPTAWRRRASASTRRKRRTRRGGNADLGADVPWSAARRLLGVPPDGGGRRRSSVLGLEQVRAWSGCGRRSTSPIRSTTAGGRDVARPGRTLAALGADAAAGVACSSRCRVTTTKLASRCRPIVHCHRHPITLTRFGLERCSGDVDGAAVERRPGRALFMGVGGARVRPARHAAQRVGRPDAAPWATRPGWPVAEGGPGRSRRVVALLRVAGRHRQDRHTVTGLDQLRDLTGRPPTSCMLDTAPDGVLRIVGDATARAGPRAFARYTYGPGGTRWTSPSRATCPWTNEDCRRAGTLHLGGTAEEIVAIEAATARGQMPERPFMLVGQQYLVDPSRSAGGINPSVSLRPRAARLPGRRHRGGRRPDRAVRPRLPRPDRGNAHAQSAQLGRYNANYVGGDIAAGANTSRQIAVAAAAGAQPVRRRGARASTSAPRRLPRAAGVHGMGGFNAAESALKRLRAGRPA